MSTTPTTTPLRTTEGLPRLREDQIRRYSRHVLVPDVGGVGQRRLLGASVVVPPGALDAAAQIAIAYLVGAGVGELALAGDPGGAVTAAEARAGVVLHPADEGRGRLDAIAAYARAHNPDVRVVAAGPAHAGAHRLALDRAGHDAARADTPGSAHPGDADTGPGQPWAALGVRAPHPAAAALVAGGAAALAVIAAIAAPTHGASP